MKKKIIFILLIMLPALTQGSEPSKKEKKQELQRILSSNHTKDTHIRENLLYELLKSGDHFILKGLIKYCKKHNLDPLINTANNLGQTPAHIASEHCKKRCLNILIKNGANLNAQDYAGWTPLHYAAASEKRGETKRNSIIKVLCDAKTDTKKLDRSLRNAYEVAKAYNHNSAALLIYSYQYNLPR